LEKAFTADLKRQNTWTNEINRLQTEEAKNLLSSYKFELQNLAENFLSENIKTKESDKAK